MTKPVINYSILNQILLYEHFAGNYILDKKNF